MINQHAQPLPKIIADTQRTSAQTKWRFLAALVSCASIGHAAIMMPDADPPVPPVIEQDRSAADA